MAEDIGFMEKLTGSGVDEEAQLQNMLYQPPGRGVAERMFQYGQQAGAGLGQSLGGLFGAIKNRKEGGTIVERQKAESERIRDNLIANQLGITPVDLKARRDIRSALAAEEYADDGTPSARLKMANRAIEVAKRVGSPEQLQRALAVRDQLTVEMKEWEKLQAETTEANKEAEIEGIKEAWTRDGTPITGVETVQNGVPGMMTKNGFRPYDEDFNRVNPAEEEALRTRGATPPNIHKMLRDKMTPTEQTKIRSMAANAHNTLVKTDRVLSSLMDYYEKGGVGSVMGSSGQALQAIDNFVLNAKGFVNAFASEGMSKHNNNLISSMLEEVVNGTSELVNLIQLPPGVERGSRAAQQHQAAIMEMAYMAARLAEPSNRGLSDNDIANALKRITGGTSSPQVMARRFIEMQADAAAELDFTLKMLHGSFGDAVTNDDIDKAILGNGLQAYREQKQKLFDKFGVRVDDTGRAVFSETMGTDVQPGEGTMDDPAETVGVDEMDDDTVLNMVLGGK